MCSFCPPVDQVLSGSVVRTLKTAELMLEKMGVERLYHGFAAEMMDNIKKQEDDVGGVLLFGNHPGITDLVNHFSLFLDPPPTDFR